MELTDRQRAFCEYFAASGNATQAAQAAGYSRRSAYSQGSRLLKNGEIRHYIQHLREAAAGSRIADAAETRALVTDILRDTRKATAARLKAADLLLKTSGAYLEDNEPLPDENEDSVQIVLPWDGRQGLPNAVMFDGVFTPLQVKDGEDQEGQPVQVYEYVDILNRPQIERLWEMEGKDEN